MEAIFCEYNRAHGGTLLPVRHTQSWNAKKAETLATPILVATYTESGVKKGVVVIQRQQLDSGEPRMSHATGATISAYVFKHDGSKCVFEKGRLKVSYAGAHGFAPGGKLVKLGQDKYGLWFEGGDIHQGYTNDYAFVVTLSEPQVLEVGNFDTGQSNRGACSDDPKERGPFTGACWGYEGRPEFIKVNGRDYYTLRISYQGTEEQDSNNRVKIVPKDKSLCYTKTSDKYVELKDTTCADHSALDAHDAFGIADTEDRRQPIPSIPRKLLK